LLSDIFGRKSRAIMALRIERAFGVKMERLTRIRSAYEIAPTRMRENTIREHDQGPAYPDTGSGG